MRYLFALTLILSVFCLSVLNPYASNTAYAQTVTRLTSNPGADVYPVWDPRGVTIAYIRSKTVGGGVYDLYKVESSAQAGESLLLNGLNQDFGVATRISWIGSTGFMAIEEAISGFEVLKFNTALAPFNRTIANGADAANSLLLNIDGGGGGGLTKISRDGLVALERFSSSGSVGNISVRVGAVSSMVGQAESTFGTVLFSQNSGSALFSNGGALNSDGSMFIVSVASGSGNDLILGSTTGAFANINLTNTGVAGFSNIFPDFSPDGTRIAFARGPAGSNTTTDLFVINVDGTGLQQLTNTPNFSENEPSWSPDGGSLAFHGIHVAGHESEFPALAAGETANYNVYMLTLPPVNTVTPKTKLKDPALVAIQNRNVTFTFTPFKKAQLAALTREFRKAKAKVTFDYKLQLTKSGKKRERKEYVSKRNKVTIKKLPPGTYSASYKVQITSKAPSERAVVKATGSSPKAVFTVN